MGLKELYESLFSIGSIKLGEFKLKSGIISPIYFDLRAIVSYPEILDSVADSIFLKSRGLKFDCVCGVPYTALPIATVISVKHGIPMLMRRKETKDYGTKKILEGVFKPGDRCLVIEDVVSTGSSVLETTELLRKEGLIVEDAIVFLEREMGGLDNLTKNGVALRYVMNITEILTSLQLSNKISHQDYVTVTKFLSQPRDVSLPSTEVEETPSRKDLLKNEVSRKLLEIIETKETNLCLSADVTTSSELLELADVMGPYICVLKTHVDILTDLSTVPVIAGEVPDVLLKIKALSLKHNFLIMEDRKFSDIGNTFRMQCFEGPFMISSWADLITAHSISGPGMLNALKPISAEQKTPGVVFVAEMSSKSNLISGDYTQQTVELANQFPELVTGFVYRNYKSITSASSFIRFMPGIGLSCGTDGGDQQYVTCEHAIREEKCDVIIVGRAILNSTDRVETAKTFRSAAWKEYKK